MKLVFGKEAARQLGVCHLWISTSAWHRAQKALQVEGSLMASPYLALMVFNPDGDIRRLWLRPVHWDGGHAPLVIASHKEFLLADLLRARSAVVFKPIQPEDFVELMRRLGLVAPDANFPNIEPRFIYRDTADLAAPIVCEVAGYAKAGHARYHLRLEEKEFFLRRPGSPWRYQRIGANDLPRNCAVAQPVEPEVKSSELTASARTAIVAGLTLFPAT